MFALIVAAVQIAHHFGDGNQIARVDFLFIFLRPARPHGAFHLGFAFQRFHRLAYHIGAGQTAHTDFHRLVGGNAQRHLVFFKRDNEQLQRDARNFLFFDRDNLAHAMRRINNIFVRAEFRLFRFGHLVLPRKPHPTHSDSDRAEGLTALARPCAIARLCHPLCYVTGGWRPRR